jgi:predicted DNA-binding protein
MAKPKAKPVRVSVFMPIEINEKLKAMSHATRLSKSAIVAAAAAQYVKTVKPKKKVA